MSLLKREVHNRLQRTIPSRLECAESLCLEIRRFVLNAGIPELRFPIELLAHECLSNAVIHGNRGAADKSVDLTLSIGRTWIRLGVTDQGSGFSWRKACRKTLDAVASNGRGLQLCTIYAQRICFNRRGNAIVLWIKRTKAQKRSVDHGRIRFGA